MQIRIHNVAWTAQEICESKIDHTNPIYSRNAEPEARKSAALLSRHEKAAVVCRREGGEIVAHAHSAVQSSIPVSQSFTDRIFECISIPLEFGKRTAVFRSENSVKSAAPPIHSNRHLVVRIQ